MNLLHNRHLTPGMVMVTSKLILANPVAVISDGNMKNAVQSSKDT
jgi:hypothetical protein